MRILGLALAVALAISAPGLASAASSPITKDQRVKGMADAPALVKAAGSDCQVSDARFVGSATDAKTKAKTALYEVACNGGEGMLVEQISTDPAPALFTCMEAAGAAAAGQKSTNQCILPANLDPKAGMLPYIAMAKVQCTPDKIRPLGHSPTDAFFELQCHEGAPGYILRISWPPSLSKPDSADPCLMFDPSSNVHCELTDRAAQMAIVDKLAAQSGKPCDIKDRGWIGVAGDGMRYYEVACTNGKGYVLQQNPSGALTKTIDCVDADNIAGGCKLTDTRQAKTEQNGLYATLAKKAGYDCAVSGYAPLADNDHGNEVVELACGATGAIGEFPVAGGPGKVIDCAHSELLGFRCTLTKPAYATLTADLKKLGKSSCDVSESRVVGLTPDSKGGYIEVGCSDGLPGYMVEYTLEPMAPKSALVCAEAKGIGGGCALANNNKHG